MHINEHTSIAYLIKQHPKALEVIVSLAPGFSRLKNPWVRKLMAGRTSIGMAADIGGCNVSDFFEKLSSLGFIYTPATKSSGHKTTEVNSLSLERIPKDNFIELDVRPMLSQGIDPLATIMKTLATLDKTQGLKIINTFIPSPLIQVLGKKGYSHKVEKISDSQYVTSFFPENSVEIEIPHDSKASGADFMQKLAEFKSRYVELDVRHLEMPQPMTKILETLSSMPDDHILYVHHKRFPVFLVPELKELGYAMKHVEQEDGVDIIIYKFNPI